MKYENTLQFARSMDRQDPLKKFRSQFYIPKIDGKTSIYFTGNSLGLQPKNVADFVKEELDDWATLGVEGHVHSRRPWVRYQNFSKKALAKIVGAKPIEVVAMNQLTVNLHLLLLSFYRPTPQRYKIIAEKGAFSSDQYAFESQIRFHNLNPDDCLVEVEARDGESSLRTEDIVKTIHDHRDNLALVIFGGVQYYTGQLFDIAAITKAGHDAGAYVGFDLAHAAGNVPLQLHKHGVDFAMWCSYKYLNSGPGGIAGAFVHERHAVDHTMPRLAGWWGHNENERFLMLKGFKPMPGVDGWQLSNHPVISSAVHLGALSLFEEAGMKNLRAKSIALTGYLQFLLNEIDPNEKYFQVLTPRNPKWRGCQLSLFMKDHGMKVFKGLGEAGVIADWREPAVIRVAPVPLYNTFEEVYRFSTIFKKLILQFNAVK